MINKFRHWVSEFFVKKGLKKPKSTQVYNLDTAQSMALLFDADSTEQLKMVQGLVKELKNDKGIKNIICIGHSNEVEKKRGAHLTGLPKHFLLYGPGEYDFFFKPKRSAQAILNFMEHPYNILVDFSTQNEQAFRHVLAHCNAQFKVGWNKESNTDFYELLIGGNQTELKDYKNQVIHYLSIINKNDAKKL